MLQTLRKGAASWVAKLLLGLLVVSFAVWGIGDIFRGWGQQYVARVGDTKITVEAFRDQYNRRVQAIGRQLGRLLTPEQARAAGLDQQVIGEMVAEAALDARAASLGLALADGEVAARVRGSALFRNAAGQFDPALLDQALRANGLSPAGYAELERRLALRQQMARALAGAPPLPATVSDLVARYRTETRSIELVTIPREAAGAIPAPSPEELARFFAERKAAFRAPEYRKVAVLALTAETLAPWVEVSDADVRGYYDGNRTMFGAPERRAVQQILFPARAEAEAAAARIAGGAGFEAVATERGLSARDIDLGTVTRQGLLDPAVADAAFALAEGAVSAPVEGRFGTALVRVTRIEPESIRPFEQVADAIRRQIAVERAKRDILDRHDKVEDERAAGQTLVEVGKKLGLDVEVLEAIDRSGRDAAGARIADFPGRDEVVEGAFQSEVGTENDPVQLGANGFVWYEVLGITRARERTLEEAKEQVDARWREDQESARVKAKADELLAKLKAGGKLADLAAAAGFTVATVDGLRRGRANEALPDGALARVFELPVGGVTAEPGEDGIGRLVLRVTDSVVPPAATRDPRIDAQLREAIETDLLAQYVARVQSELGADVNLTRLRQAIGGDRS